MGVHKEKPEHEPGPLPPPRHQSGSISRQNLGRLCRARRHRDPKRCTRPWLLALLVAIAALAAPEAAGGSPEGEASLHQAVKAAFVYNFTRFVSWPAESPLRDAPAFAIGVLGDEPLADALEAAVRGKHIEGRPFVVRRFRTAKDVVPCPVLYVDRGQSDSVPRLLEQLRGWGVLTVGDAKGFASAGGAIGLLLEDGRVRFEVGLAAPRAAGLEVSSKLLRLSRPNPCLSCSPPASSPAIARDAGSGREH